jgi:hypothetical protein
VKANYLDDAGVDALPLLESILFYETETSSFLFDNLCRFGVPW